MSDIAVRNLFKSYAAPPNLIASLPGHPVSVEPVEVLRGIDLDIAAGEFVAIVGSSGAGKSTLLHLLGALDTPTAGSIHYGEVDLGGMRSAERAVFRNQTVGFVFQFHHLLPEFTAIENVMMPARLGRRDQAWATERAAELLGELGLGARLTHRPAELSGGEQQRVALARALMLEPKVVIADEPTGNLDDHTSREIHELILQINRVTGVTFIIATHSESLARLAGRLVRLADGHILE